MASALSPAERIERQRIDQKMLAALDASECPVSVTGHRSAADVRAGRNPVPVGDPKPPTHYRVVYEFDTLIGPGKRHRPTVIEFAPLAGGNYPAGKPTAYVIGESEGHTPEVPWTPHFARNVPVCLGPNAWEPYRTWLVDLVIHTGRLLNFDEPPPVPGYDGYNGAAIAYWRNTLRFQPLDPNLTFPVIRAEDVLGPGRMHATEAPAATGTRFAASGAAAVHAGARFGGTRFGGTRFGATPRTPGRFAATASRS